MKWNAPVAKVKKKTQGPYAILFNLSSNCAMERNEIYQLQLPKINLKSKDKTTSSKTE